VQWQDAGSMAFDDIGGINKKAPPLTSILAGISKPQDIMSSSNMHTTKTVITEEGFIFEYKIKVPRLISQCAFRTRLDSSAHIIVADRIGILPHTGNPLLKHIPFLCRAPWADICNKHDVNLFERFLSCLREHE